MNAPAALSVADHVRLAISDHVGLDLEDVTDSSRLAEDIGLDWGDWIELAADLENGLGVWLDDDAFDAPLTVRGLIDQLEKAVAAQAEEAP